MLTMAILKKLFSAQATFLHCHYVALVLEIRMEVGGWNANIVAASSHCWQNSVDIPTVLQRRCDNGIRF